MSTNNEDNYRIEVWDGEEEKTLLETISKSSDFASAWPHGTPQCGAVPACC